MGKVGAMPGEREEGKGSIAEAEWRSWKERNREDGRKGVFDGLDTLRFIPGMTPRGM